MAPARELDISVGSAILPDSAQEWGSGGRGGGAGPARQLAAASHRARTPPALATATEASVARSVSDLWVCELNSHNPRRNS